MCEEKIFSNESFIVSNSKYEPKIQSFKEKFKIICDTLCSKIDSIDERLSNINVENES